MSFTTDGQHAYAPAPSDSAKEDSPSAAVNEGINQPEAGNVDKIREILFGGQMRAYDKRFSRLEERLTKEVFVFCREVCGFIQNTEQLAPATGMEQSPPFEELRH